MDKIIQVRNFLHFLHNPSVAESSICVKWTNNCYIEFLVSGLSLHLDKLCNSICNEESFQSLTHIYPIRLYYNIHIPKDYCGQEDSVNTVLCVKYAWELTRTAKPSRDAVGTNCTIGEEYTI